MKQGIFSGTIVGLLLIATAISLGSVFGDPKLYSGSECCACLQLTSPEGQKLQGEEAFAQNCLPGDTQETETCADEVASQITQDQNGDAVRVESMDCVTQHCDSECQGAKENDIFFESLGGG